MPVPPFAKLTPVMPSLDVRLEIERLPFGRAHCVLVILLAVATLVEIMDEVKFAPRREASRRFW